MRQVMLLAALLAAAITGSAYATPMLKIQLSEKGYTTQTIMGAPGTTVTGPTTYGGYTLTVTGNGDITDLTPYMSLSVQVSKVPSSKSPLTISITETGLPAGPGTVVDMTSANSAIFYGGGSSVNTSSYYDLLDAPFGQANPFDSGTLNSTSTSTSYEDVFDASSPFSITETLVLTPGATTAHPQVQATINVQLPEPTSLLLFVPALAGLLLLRHRRSGAG